MLEVAKELVNRMDKAFAFIKEYVTNSEDKIRALVKKLELKMSVITDIIDPNQIKYVELEVESMAKQNNFQIAELDANF